MVSETMKRRRGGWALVVCGVFCVLMLLVLGGWWFVSRNVPALMSDERLVEVTAIDTDWDNAGLMTDVREWMWNRLGHEHASAHNLMEEFVRRVDEGRGESLLWWRIENRVERDWWGSAIGQYFVARRGILPDPDQLRRLIDDDPEYGWKATIDVMRWYHPFDDHSVNVGLTPGLCYFLIEKLPGLLEQERGRLLMESLVPHIEWTIWECGTAEEIRPVMWRDERKADWRFGLDAIKREDEKALVLLRERWLEALERFCGCGG